MITGLKSDNLVNKVGGRFKLAALIQRRMVELLQGARPLVETKGLTDIEVVVQEILEDKIDIKPYVMDVEGDDVEA
ncbi:MAG TPA: DNA-directed RNA polymerase subunit omega [Phycisphaerae bacterium]|nr:DNA-directed RNA polymerase subunit omega [Phycisphaerae bacterium]